MHARTRLVLAFVAARAGPRTVRGRSNAGTTVTATTTTGTSGAGALTAPICRPGAPPCIALGSLVASRSTAFTSAGLAEGARSRAAWSRWRCSSRRTMRRAASDALYRHTSAIARGSRSRFSFRRSPLFLPSFPTVDSNSVGAGTGCGAGATEVAVDVTEFVFAP